MAEGNAENEVEIEAEKRDRNCGHLTAEMEGEDDPEIEERRISYLFQAYGPEDGKAEEPGNIPYS